MQAAAIHAAAQDTLYFEDFSPYADGTTIGGGTPPMWTTDVSKTNFSFWGYFETRNQSFAANYTKGEAVWVSRTIMASAHTDLRISANFSETIQFPGAADYIRAYYRRNNGPEILWASHAGNFDNQFSLDSIPDGDSVQIIIRTDNGDLNENMHITFDNILLTGELAAPPIANFTSNTVVTCDGNVQFTDLSSKKPDNWRWDFGDGNSDSVQHPLHTYTSGGIYTVTLIAGNALGTDTIVKTAYVTVDLGGGPAAMACKPVTTGYCCGFGITGVSFNTIGLISGDAAEGYKDFSCNQQTTVTEGKSYTLSITTGGTQNYNIGAWIDFNNDSVFDPAKETVYAGNDVQNPLASVTIPAGAVRDTVLRMRISADYAFNAAPGPCSNVEYGQAEDYAVTIIENTSPPVADFIAVDSFSCSGTVNFFDRSENLPASWYWEFGDGATSFLKNPVRNYTSNNSFVVRLIATNAYGADTVEKTVVVDKTAGPAAAACMPQTLGYCCNYGIYKVSFNTINHPSGNASEGYTDFSCSEKTTVIAGNAYAISVQTGPDNPEDVQVWIDYNNDAAFDTAEIVFSATNAFNPSGTVNIPASGITGSVPLRMRVVSDFAGSGANACANLTYGQAEDYGVIIDIPIGAGEIREDAIALYPNPASTRVSVLLPGPAQDGTVLVIRDMAGRSVLERRDIHTNNITVNVEYLPAGIYHLSVSGPERYVTARLVIAK